VGQRGGFVCAPWKTLVSVWELHLNWGPFSIIKGWPRNFGLFKRIWGSTLLKYFFNSWEYKGSLVNRRASIEGHFGGVKPLVSR